MRVLVVSMVAAVCWSGLAQAQRIGSGVPGFVQLRPGHHVRHHKHSRHSAARIVSTTAVPALTAKAQEIARSCGSKVISAFRPHALIAGTSRPSLHASGHAVDMAGNPACIYAHLSGWPGGYSVDYGVVRHVHISLGGREDGARFVHGGRSHRA